MVLLAGGEPRPAQPVLAAACGRELLAVTARLLDLLERTDDTERDLRVDLLGLCARQHPAMRPIVSGYLRRLADRGLRTRVSRWLDELEDEPSIPPTS